MATSVLLSIGCDVCLPLIYPHAIEIYVQYAIEKLMKLNSHSVLWHSLARSQIQCKHLKFSKNKETSTISFSLNCRWNVCKLKWTMVSSQVQSTAVPVTRLRFYAAVITVNLPCIWWVDELSTVQYSNAWLGSRIIIKLSKHLSGVVIKY